MKRAGFVVIAAVGIAIGGLAAFPIMAGATTPGWSPAGSMSSARTGQTATLLTNGKVLVAGGSDGNLSLASADLYDPATNSWSAAAPMAHARQGHTATLLQSGSVLVTGGLDGGSTALNSAELYDPAANNWSAAASMAVARINHTATLLPTGKVLVTGGTDGTSTFSTSTLSSAELYDPSTNSWTGAASMGAKRLQHTATLLGNGKVLVAGGQSGQTPCITGGFGPTPLTSAELYDPGANTWSSAGSMASSRYSHTATLLDNGKVLVAGGAAGNPLACALATSAAELYDPATNSWSGTEGMSAARVSHTATLLANHTVLVTGGTDNTTETYEPIRGHWSRSFSMASTRFNHTATRLLNDVVLVTGGVDASGIALATAEIYAAPLAKVDPHTLAFGYARAGTTTATPSQAVTVTGSGSVPVMINTISIGGANAADFLITTDGCSGQTLAFAQTCPVAIAFQPGTAASGARTATLSIPNSGPQPLSVALQGTDMPPQPLGAGDLIISHNNNAVDEYTPDGTFVRHVMSGFEATGAVFDRFGNLYVTDFTGNVIHKRDVFTGTVSVFAFGFLGKSFDNPESIALSQDGSRMYVSNASKDLVINPPGRGIAVLDAVTGNGLDWLPVPSSHGGAVRGQSDWLATDAASNLFMSNENNTQGVMRVDLATGDLGSPNLIPSLPDINYSMTFEPSGDVWVADTSSLMEYTAGGALLRTVQNASLTNAFATAIDVTGGQVYVGDLINGMVFTFNTGDGSLASQFTLTPVAGQETGIAGISVVPGIPPHPTTTAVSCVPASVTVGLSTTCTATVTDTAVATASTPTGPVSFGSDGAGTFSAGGSCTLVGTGPTSGACSVTYTPTAVGIGTHTITATYAGDSSHASSHGSTGVTVTTRASATTLTCSPSPDQVGMSTTCTATVADAGSGTTSTPTGAVAFGSSGAGLFSNSASCNLSSTGTPGTAGCSLTYTPTALGSSGSQTITATYGGDATFAGSAGTFTLLLDTPPTAASGGPYAGVEGSSIAITGTAGDPDGSAVVTVWSVVSNAGNDLGAACVIANPAALSTSLTCNDEGSFTLTLTATDGAGLTATSSTTVTVLNVAPGVGSISGLPAGPIPVGSTVSPSVSFTDAGTNDSHTATWNWGDGSTSAGVVTEANGSGSVTGSHTYTAAGTYTVTVTVTDADGASASATAQVVVDSPPTADSGGPYAGVEGAAIAISGTASDPDGSAVVTHWSTVSNAGNDAGSACVITNPAALSTTVTCNNEGSYALTLTATDSVGQTATSSTTLTVSNAAPVVGSITGLPAGPIAINTAVSASVTFTDAGTLDPHTAVWNWGDGSTSAGVVTEANGSGSVTGSHTYTAAGVYTVTVTVTDADGASGSAMFEFVVVFDPSAGFVTGGGWFTSPVGAYLASPNATGKASFGFVAKYQKGANIPSGNTQFQFQAGSLNFHSTAYQWLVIAGNCKAQFKGTGMINGSGSYTFLLSGTDGERCGSSGPDTFRIQITDNASGATVYDNGTDEPIGGGDIQVHS